MQGVGVGKRDGGELTKFFRVFFALITLGVGGSPLLVNLGAGGELFFRSRRRGGRDGTDGSTEASPPSATAGVAPFRSASEPLLLTGNTPVSMQSNHNQLILGSVSIEA